MLARISGKLSFSICLNWLLIAVLICTAWKPHNTYTFCLIFDYSSIITGMIDPPPHPCHPTLVFSKLLHLLSHIIIVNLNVTWRSDVLFYFLQNKDKVNVIKWTSKTQNGVKIHRHKKIIPFFNCKYSKGEISTSTNCILKEREGWMMKANVLFFFT